MQRPGNPTFGRVLITKTVAGFCLEETVYSCKSAVPKHEHEEAICCMALDIGCAEVYLGQTREVKPLALDFLPPYHSHALKFDGPSVRAFSVDFTAGLVDRLREYSRALVPSLYARGSLATLLFARVYKEFHEEDEESPLAIEGLIFELLAEVSRRQSDKGVRPMPRWLAQTKELLHAHFHEQLRLAAIADTVGVHQIHLAREFRKYCGCTVGDYVRKLRIDFATEQLSKTDKPLVAIAVAAGFSDQSHFNRTFKQLMNMTPSEYRNLFASR
jgi:AraC family transcriptional regulator